MSVPKQVVKFIRRTGTCQNWLNVGIILLNRTDSRSTIRRLEEG